MASNPQPIPNALSEEELQQCLQDPRKAKTIRGPNFIVCLEDGELLHQITPTHLRQAHGIQTLAEYRAKPCATGLPRYNPGTALIADSLHEQLSKFRKKPTFLRHLERVRHPIHLVIKVRPSRKGQTSQEYRLNKSESQRGSRDDLQKAPDSAIARLRLQGLTRKEIAEHVGLQSRSTVGTRLAKVGFPGSRSRFAHGQPITGRAILDLCEDFGLTKQDLVKVLKREKRVQLPTWLAESIYRQSIRSKVDAPLGIEVADSLLALRKKWVDAFCVGDGRRGKKIREFLKSEIRDVPEVRAQLKESVGELRSEHPADVLGWICEQARKEVAQPDGDGSAGRRFRTLLFFGSELEALIAEDPDLLNGKRSTDDVVDVLLARDYGATPYRVRCAAHNELTPLDPRTLRQRLLEANRRPTDWDERPVRWRIIATELFTEDYMSNKALALRLDSAGIVRCPYGATWESSVEHKGFLEFIRRIRLWVGKPGMIKGKIPTQ